MTILRRMKMHMSSFPGTFWTANTIEIFERMAWYGFFAVSSLYITGKTSEGALGFTSEQRGTLQGVVTFILYLLPVFTGALADRYGFKKMFAIAFAVMLPAYYLLGQVTSFTGFFLVFLLVAVGAAIFKPVVVGTVAHTTDESNSSIGFGIFYMMVNVGGFVGPIIAGIVRGWSWKYVFIMSSAWIVVNFILLALFYRDPTHERDSKQARTLNKVLSDMVEVLGNGRLFLFVSALIVLLICGTNGWMAPAKAAGWALAWTLLNIFYDLYLRSSRRKHEIWVGKPMQLGNWRFVLFLCILSGFWTVFNQIFFTLPEYIRDFTETASILLWLQGFFATFGMSGLAAHMGELVAQGYKINPEYLINIDAGAIIIFQVVVSWIIARFKIFFSLVLGTIVAALSMIALVFGASGWLVVFGIVVFAFGEMMTSPKSQEYIGRIAPEDRKALYMGYYFVAIALGNLFGGVLSGQLYGKLARDMGRPDLMWLIFAALGFLTAIALYLYDKWIVPTVKDKF